MGEVHKAGRVETSQEGENMDFKVIQNEIDRLIVLVIAAELIALIVFLFLMYLVTKAAIRDGIKESGIVDAIQSLRTPIEVPKMPPMRAER